MPDESRSVAQVAGAETVLEVRDLRKFFPVKKGLLTRVQAYVQAVDGVSFSIAQGETLGVVASEN